MWWGVGGDGAVVLVVARWQFRGWRKILGEHRSFRGQAPQNKQPREWGLAVSRPALIELLCHTKTGHYSPMQSDTGELTCCR